jgi:hypothetical protein
MKRYKQEKQVFFLLLLVVTIILISASSIFYFFFLYEDDNSAYISAFEGKKIADKVANEWRSNAILSILSNQNAKIKDGKSEYWYYEYYSPSLVANLSSNNTHTESLLIIVYASGKIESYNDSFGQTDFQKIDTAMDSVEAFRIAMSHREIKDFYKRNPTCEISMSCNGKYTNWNDPKEPWKSGPCWYISLNVGAGEYTTSAHVIINSTTNRTEYVSADTGYQIFFMCGSCLIIPSIVIPVYAIVFVFISSKEQRKLYETKKVNWRKQSLLMYFLIVSAVYLTVLYVLSLLLLKSEIYVGKISVIAFIWLFLVIGSGCMVFSIASIVYYSNFIRYIHKVRKPSSSEIAFLRLAYVCGILFIIISAIAIYLGYYRFVPY